MKNIVFWMKVQLVILKLLALAGVVFTVWLIVYADDIAKVISSLLLGPLSILSGS